MYDPDGNLVERRPAETFLPLISAVVVILGRIFGFSEDREIAESVTMILSFVPALISAVVSRRK
jgi:hypothetical protein